MKESNEKLLEPIQVFNLVCVVCVYIGTYICMHVYKCVFIITLLKTNTARPENIRENIPFTNTIKNTKSQELTRNVLKCMKKNKLFERLEDLENWRDRT